MHYNRYKKTGWINESQRHSLARKGVKTGRKSYFADKDVVLQNIISTNNRVETKDNMNKGVVLSIDNGVAKVLTDEKRVIDVPVADLEKMTEQRLFQELKAEPEITIVPAPSNKTGSIFGEWTVDKLGFKRFTGNVLEMKELHGDQPIVVKGPTSTFRVSANNRTVLSELARPRETPEEQEELR